MAYKFCGTAPKGIIGFPKAGALLPGEHITDQDQIAYIENLANSDLKALFEEVVETEESETSIFEEE